MRKRVLSLALALVFCMTLALTVNAASDMPVSDPVETIGQLLVLDQAGLLTENEVSTLNSKLLSISSTYNAQIMILTIDSMEGNDIDEFINYIYDEMELGYGENRDGVLLLISMDPREYRILTNGMADAAIGESGIDMIGDRMVSDLSDGYYADAFMTFAEECAYYLDGHINGFPFDAGATLLTALVIGLVIGVIVALVLKGQLKSVRQQKQANVYIKSGSMQVTTRSDLFLYRQVSRTKKETSSSSNSGSSRSVGGGSF